MNKYIPVIGLEIHVELSTQSKMFCQCPADWFGKPANSQTCPVCLGMPGALPVPNKQAIASTLFLSKTLNCTISKTSKFDRKHYFYPDLPKGYQISQYDEPFGMNGSLAIIDPKTDSKKTYRIRRVHLEEDTGKLIHKEGQTLIDFNRAGVPLVEIVTEPDFDNSDDVKRFLEELHTIIKEYLHISDADMEKGSMRLEPNISVKAIARNALRVTNDKTNQKQANENQLPNYKVEVKNINSFKYVKDAIDYEVERHMKLLAKGETPQQETRGYNENKKITVSQRSKEEAHDYRYFPEPDIPPINIPEQRIDDIIIPDLPLQKIAKYRAKIRLTDAFTLTRTSQASALFEGLTEVLSKDKKLTDVDIYQGVANLIVNKRLSIKDAFDQNIEKARKSLVPVQTDEVMVDELVKKTITQYPQAVEDARSGKESARMFLVGQVMRIMKGRADVKLVAAKVTELLKQQEST